VTAPPHRSLAAIVPLAPSASGALAPLAGVPPLLRVVRNLLESVADPSAVVVAAADRLIDDVRDLLAGAEVSLAPVAEPATRAQCLAAGLELVRRQDPARSVLVHDLRQPLPSREACDRVVARLLEGDPVVLPVLPVTDSVKAVDANGSVAATVDRATLRVVQYPRGFAVDQLAGLLASAAADDVDEVNAAIRAGSRITVVDGDPEAFTAELPRDTPFIEAVIATRG
jgi:2-C-methyl-D-erythritol 4-phosphate cytidylyltransferase